MQRQDTSQTVEQLKPRKNKYQFSLDRDRKVLIQSDFDNGNIALIRQVTQLQYRLQAVSDTKSATPKKTWFHFRVSAPKNIRVRLIIENVSIYQNMYEDKDWARPVMNDGSGWKQIKDCFLTYRGQIGIIIDHTFINQNFVYFAMALPHSYENCEKYLKQLAYRIPDHIQYQDEIIAKSWGGLNLHLLRFTAKQTKGRQGNSSSGNLLLQSQQNQKKTTNRKTIETYGSSKKPIIFITARVHPGQVGSSHCLIGMIDFLTRFNSLQSYLILKMFEVMIIPMVNPDGVFDGNYRMDLNNTNLNRVYQQPSPQLHPTIFRIKQLISSLINPGLGNHPSWSKQKTQRIMSLISRKIMFHFDLHSHSCIKHAFIYGNAFDQIVTQTQSQLYCKLLDQNSQVFRYGLSQFGEKHMKMKDKGEPLTKQGCARVVISKMANIIYSYTVQTAIFPYFNKQPLSPVSNTQFTFQNFIYEQATPEFLSAQYNTKNQLFIDNMILGHSIMITILDLLQKNPYSRFSNNEEILDSYRREISQSLLQNQERFKLLDIKAHQKVRNISKFCKQQITNKNQRCWDYLSYNKIFLKIKWPSCFKQFQFANNNNPAIASEMLKIRNRTKTQSDSQRQLNDFLHPRNMRKRILNLQIDDRNIQSKNKNQESPPKQTLSPRNVHIQLDIPSSAQNIGTGILPQIKPAFQRKNKNRVVSNSLNKYHAVTQQSEQPNQFNLQLKQIKELKQLQQKESTKNIVLSFIHQQMEKINNLRKNAQKSMAVQSRLASYKLIKKASRSSKALNPMGAVNIVSVRSGTGVNNISSAIHNNEGSLLLKRSKSKKKLKEIETCEQIINRRKNNSIQEDQQQQFQEQQGIYYVEQRQFSKKQEQIIQKQVVIEKKNENNHAQKKKTRIPGSLQKVAEYPLYPIERQKDPSNIIITNKRELAKIKYSQIKKKNIIRQDLSSNIKLPQLRAMGSNNQQDIKNNNEHDDKKNKNGLSINLNLNLNLNLHIDSAIRQITGRARAATMPDEI